MHILSISPLFDAEQQMNWSSGHLRTGRITQWRPTDQTRPGADGVEARHLSALKVGMQAPRPGDRRRPPRQFRRRKRFGVRSSWASQKDVRKVKNLNLRCTVRIMAELYTAGFVMVKEISYTGVFSTYWSQEKYYWMLRLHDSRYSC